MTSTVIVSQLEASVTLRPVELSLQASHCPHLNIFVIIFRRLCSFLIPSGLVSLDDLLDMVEAFYNVLLALREVLIVTTFQ